MHAIRDVLRIRVIRAYVQPLTQVR